MCMQSCRSERRHSSRKGRQDRCMQLQLFQWCTTGGKRQQRTCKCLGELRSRSAPWCCKSWCTLRQLRAMCSDLRQHRNQFPRRCWSTVLGKCSKLHPTGSLHLDRVCKNLRRCRCMSLVRIVLAPSPIGSSCQQSKLQRRCRERRSTSGRRRLVWQLCPTSKLRLGSCQGRCRSSKRRRIVQLECALRPKRSWRFRCKRQQWRTCTGMA